MVGFNWLAHRVEVELDNLSAWISRAYAISNHSEFCERGYPPVTFVESVTGWRESKEYEANPFYHTSRDTVNQTNVRFVHKTNVRFVHKTNVRFVHKITEVGFVTMDGLASRSFARDETAIENTIDSLLSPNQPLIIFSLL